jgi:NitT/TauT family transport system ATP-binding protein
MSLNGADRALVQFDEVYKLFSRGGATTHAIGPLSASLAPGEFLAIVGPSGCGKSTLLRLLSGLLPVSAGAIRRDESLAPAGAMSMVFQTPALLPWRTALGNVLVPAQLLGLDKRAATTRARELLELVELEGFAGALPHELSGGMQQRAAVCRALLGEPILLLMDEPFGALDAITREQITWDLQRIWMQNESSVVFVTHSVEEALLLADRVLVMTARPGRVAAIVENDLPRPRTLDTLADPAFTTRANQIRTLLLEAVNEAGRRSETMVER